MSSFQTPSTNPASAPATDGYVPVDGNTREQVTETGSLFTAYLLIWAILILFALQHLRGLGGIVSQLGRLEQVVPKGSAAEEDA